MKYFYHIIPLFFMVLMTGSPSLGDDHSPTAQLQPVIEKIIVILDDDSLKGDENREQRRSKIMSTVSSGFNFREMSRRVLGKTWNDLSADERDYFVTQVTKLFENVYIGKLESYGGRTVEFVAERVKGKRAQVTTLIPYEQSKIPIHYILQREQDKWLVYDINIEGISLVRNYKEQFRTILRQQKYEGLIKVIEEKNKTFANDNKTG